MYEGKSLINLQGPTYDYVSVGLNYSSSKINDVSVQKYENTYVEMKIHGKYVVHYCTLTFALLGGVFEHPPLRFFADSKKTAARSAAGFSPTLSPIFLATFVKVSILGHARSGHQVRSSDHTLQKIYNRAPATVFEGKL